MILRKCLVAMLLIAGACAQSAEQDVSVVNGVPEDLTAAESRSSSFEGDLIDSDDQIALESTNAETIVAPDVDEFSAPLGAEERSDQEAAASDQSEARSDTYGAPEQDPVDSYGAPLDEPLGGDSYGAPQAPPVGQYGAPPQPQSGPIPVPLPLNVNPSSIVIPQGPNSNYGAPPPKPAYKPRPPPPKSPRPPPPYRPPPPKRRPPPPRKPAYKPRPPPRKAPPKKKPPPPPPKPAYKPKPKPSYKPRPPPPPPKKPAYKPQPKPSYKPKPKPQPKYKPRPSPPKPQYRPAPKPKLPPPPPKYKPQPPAVIPPKQPSYGGNDDPWPKAQPDMPKITNLDVTCEKNLMKVFVQFDKPFYGIIFSKGHFSDRNCVHLPAALGKNSASFDVSINSCGTTGNTENGLYGYGADSGSGTYFENTIVVQYDPQVQEVWDQARKLRCTWHDQYEKSVTFRPFPVDMLDVVRADFAGDNVGCWMQIQVGKGPWASEVSGLVKIGQTMTMVLAIKDDEQKFDMMVRNCMAHDGKRAPIQLVDQKGCVTRPKLMSKFSKIKNFGSSASVLSYAHFQAFKFPDSMEVHFQCTIQICRYQCPDQCAAPTPKTPPATTPAPDTYGAPQATPVSNDGEYGSPQAAPVSYGAPPPPGYSAGASRARREAPGEIVEERVVEIDLEDVGVEKIIQVVSSGDLTFAIKENPEEGEGGDYAPVRSSSLTEDQGYICMSTPAFAATLVILLAILVISCLLSAFLCLRHRSYYGESSLIAAFANPVFAHKKGHF